MELFVGDFQEAHEVDRLKERLNRVMCRIIAEGPLALESCFLEVLKILRHPCLQLHKAWS